MRIAASLLAIALPLGGGVAASARSPDGPVRLGQTASVHGPRVTPLRLIEDSRCPMNARCIRAGTVVVRARVAGGRWSKTLDLTLNEPVHVADGVLTLVAVTPDRIAGQRLDSRCLRFAFAFDGGL